MGRIPAVCLLCIVASNACVRRSPTGNLAFVSLCELVSDHARYNGKTLRVRGVLHSSPEEAFLWDPGCNAADNWIYYDWGTDQSTPASVTSRTRILLARDGNALVTVVGRFYRPTDSMLPNPRSGPAHRRFQFEPLKIEEANPSTAGRP
jgi:hypothetical protein